MAGPLRDALDAPTALWSRLARRQQLLVLGFAILIPVAILVGSQRWGEGEWVPLFASLTPEEAGTIVAELKSAKTPYRIGGAGDQILVPAGQAGEIRLRMAAQGLPLGGGVGFEVFDKSPFGMSDFGQRLNYQRALQGELSRTISHLRQIVRARVHLVLPQPSLFTERDRPASASVFLQLSPGARLGSDQVRGIVHLVASSVEGLSPDRVTVVDTAGRVLSVGAEAEPTSLSPRRLEIKTAVEEGLERRVQSLLDGALGPGRAMTRVSAQLNLDQVDRTEERFDPNPVVRREVRTVETSTGSTATPVLPVSPPVAGAPPAPQSSTTTNQGNREAESVDYELTRVVARTLTTPGEIQRLSVAVLLRMNTRVTSKDGKELREPAPRSGDEIEKLRTIVMSAVGYTEARGDQVTVVELPFDAAAAEADRMLVEAPADPQRPGGWRDPRLLGGVTLGVGLGVAAVVWVIRRGRSRRRALAEVARTLDMTVADAGGEARIHATPHAPREVPTLEPDTEPLPELSEEFARIGEQRKSIRERAYKLASTEPDATAQLLRAWMVKRKPGAPAEPANAR